MVSFLGGMKKAGMRRPDVSFRLAGDGLARLTPSGSDKPTRLLTVPFTLPDELVLVHIHRHEPDFYMSHGDVIKILEPSPKRKLQEGEVQQNLATKEGEEVSVALKATREKFGERVQCKYFGLVPCFFPGGVGSRRRD